MRAFGHPKFFQCSFAANFLFRISLLEEAKKTNDEDDIYGGSTDDESVEPNQNKVQKVSSPLSPKETSSSDRDTEDELKR